MRWNGFLLASVFVVVTLSGCSDKGGGDADDLQALDCPTADLGAGVDVGGSAGSGNGSADEPLDDLNGTLSLLSARQAENGTAADGNDTEEVLETTSVETDGCPDATPPAPAVPPVAALVMTDDAGVVQNGTTYILSGQNVTFSAAGSSDDGAIQLAALTVRDANGTRTVQLYDGGFQDATLAFAHEGPVNVTLRVLDDEGEAGLVETMLYVNRLHSLSIPVDAFMPAGGDAGTCDYPADPPLLWQRTMDYAHFVVNAGAQWISAEMTGGTGQFAICDPEDTPLSEASSTAAETERGTGPLASSPQYAVFGVATGASEALTFEVLVHYEP